MLHANKFIHHRLPYALRVDLSKSARIEMASSKQKCPWLVSKLCRALIIRSSTKFAPRPGQHASSAPCSCRCLGFVAPILVCTIFMPCLEIVSMASDAIFHACGSASYEPAAAHRQCASGHVDGEQPRATPHLLFAWKLRP